jgi:hypothetical protein
MQRKEGGGAALVGRRGGNKGERDRVLVAYEIGWGGGP